MSISLSHKNAWATTWTALVTPLQKDKSLDRESLSLLLKRQIASGIKNFVIAGSTGEGSLISNETFQELLTETQEITKNDHCAIVAGVTCSSTDETLEKAKTAISCGVHGLLASPPPYIKAPDRSLLEFFMALTELKTPICLYEIPGRCAQSISENLLIEIIRADREKNSMIHALKDASCNFERLARWSKKLSEEITFLSGDDASYPEFLGNGGQGIVSVATHFLAEHYQTLLLEKDSPGEAAKKHSQKIPFIDALFKDSNPIPCKSLAQELSFIKETTFIHPLTHSLPEDLQELKRLYKQQGELS